MSAGGEQVANLIRQAQPIMPSAMARAVPAGRGQRTPSIDLRPLSAIVAERRAPTWLKGLRNVLEARVMAVLAGPRGSFKSFVALHWAMRAAVAGHGVVILSGEGAGLSQRAAAWLLVHGQGLRLDALPVSAFERPANLGKQEVRAAVAAAVRAQPWRADLVVIDTLSKYSPGLDENDNAEMAEYLAGVASDIRDDMGASVLLVAHSGHADASRPRGASALMANPDAEYIVKRDPGAMSFAVTRDRFKDTPSLPPLGYCARPVDLGYADDEGQPVTSLALEDADAPAMASKAKGVGKNQERAMIALAEWVRANSGSDLIDSDQLRQILSAQGVSQRQRRAEVTQYLVAAGALTPSVGGHSICRGYFDGK